jgi:hypothetical protein
MAGLLRPFPRVLSVTRYMDLRPCHGPDDPEWKALMTSASCKYDETNDYTSDATKSTSMLYGTVEDFANDESVANTLRQSCGVVLYGTAAQAT